jgi:hypothetical protein
MAAPRVPIAGLPVQSTMVDTDLLVVQNGAVTKHMTVGLVTATFTTLSKGLVPAPGVSAGLFLRDDGVWAIPVAGTVDGGDADDLIDAGGA